MVVTLVEAFGLTECNMCFFVVFRLCTRSCQVAAFSDSLLLTPLYSDDINDVTPRVSTLVGCDRLVSEPEEHGVHLKLVLELLRKEKLYAKFTKSEKRKVKLRQVKAMSMTIQSSVKDKILYTLIDTSKVENAPAKMLCDLNQQMEKRADDGMTLAAQSEAFKQENSEMDDLPCGLADVVESVRDAIGFESHVLWAEIEESSLTGLELVQETTDKVVLVKEKPKGAIDHQNSYVDYRCKPLEGKLAPRYVEPFEIVERIGSIACRLRLSEELSSVHDTFHVSNLKKRFVDANLHVSLDEIETDKTLYFVEESMGIMDREI
nr:hypothetical protein [Tanacetum cinerariifolium]